MRNRTLRQVNDKLLTGRTVLQDTIDDLLDRRSSVTVLELGFGEGRALMELATAYRDQPVRFYGVDGSQVEPVERAEDLRETARRYGISNGVGSPARLPDVRFYRLGLPTRSGVSQAGHELKFDAESVDLVYSAVMLRFVWDKVRVLEDVARVLRSGGTALIHLGGPACRYGRTEVKSRDRLTPGPAYLVVREGDHVIPVEDYLAGRSTSAISVEAINAPNLVIRLRKLHPGALDLGLQHEAGQTIRMRDLQYEVRPGVFDDGTRSVYRPTARVVPSGSRSH